MVLLLPFPKNNVEKAALLSKLTQILCKDDFTEDADYTENELFESARLTIEDLR